MKFWQSCILGGFDYRRLAAWPSESSVTRDFAFAHHCFSNSMHFSAIEFAQFMEDHLAIVVLLKV